MMYFAHDRLQREPHKNEDELEELYSSSSLSMDNSDSEYSDFEEKKPAKKSMGKAAPSVKLPAAGAVKTARTSHRNVLTEGGRAAVARKVTADLGEDDQIIVDMKRSGNTDREISDFLRQTDRVNYHPKTIGTRWKRLRIALAKAKDEELDRGDAKWSESDDVALAAALKKAETAVARLKQQAENDKWEIVSRELSIIKGAQLFSQNACRARYESLAQKKEADYLVQLATAADDEDEELVPARESRSPEETMDVDPAIKADTALAAFVREHQASPAPVPRNTPGNGVRRPQSVPFSSIQTLPFRTVRAPINLSIDGGSADRLHPLTENLNPTTVQPHKKTRRSAFRSPHAQAGFSTLSAASTQAMNRDVNLRKARTALEGLELKPLDQMNRGELRAELQARGLRRDGQKDSMLDTLKAARAGAGDLPSSCLPPDDAALRSMLARQPAVAPKVRPTKRPRRTVDEDEIEDDENVA